MLHVGLHKTASTFVQHVLEARRAALLEQGVLYPVAGTAVEDHQRTREGAQSGHIRLATPGTDAEAAVREMQEEASDGVGTLLLSAEDLSRPARRFGPRRHVELFAGFASVDVVVVLRRQDAWVESYYKQLVDQYKGFETRSLEEWVEAAPPALLDLHGRLGVWRDLVGPDRFHALSYDDLPGGGSIARRLLEVAGIRGPLLDEVAAAQAPRYDSVRGIDTLGLRILNGHRIRDRDVRNRTARAIYAAAPAGDVELMSPVLRARIQERCAEGNARIEDEWGTGPVPGFRFGRGLSADPGRVPDGAALLAYVDEVLALCATARREVRAVQ